MTISLTFQVSRASDSGVPRTMALCAPIRAESLGEIPEIFLFGSCSSGASLWGYHRLWPILRIQGLCNLISSRALILGRQPKGHAISISGISRYPVSVCLIHKILQIVKKVYKRGF